MTFEQLIERCITDEDRDLQKQVDHKETSQLRPLCQRCREEFDINEHGYCATCQRKIDIMTKRGSMNLKQYVEERGLAIVLKELTDIQRNVCIEHIEPHQKPFEFAKAKAVFGCWRVVQAFDDGIHRPIFNCQYGNDNDGCCEHPDAMTPECHVAACPFYQHDRFVG